MALLFQVTPLTADGSAANLSRGIGMAVSATQRCAFAASSLDAQATSNTDRRHDNTKCLVLTNSSGTAQIEADLTSMDSDGFTLSVTADGTAYLVTYFAIGNIEAADLQVVQAPASASSVPYTTTGNFQPDCLIALSCAMVAAPPAGTTTSILGMGWATSATAEQCITGAAANAAATSDANAERNTSNVVHYNSAPGTTQLEGNLTSFDATGYTINWTNVGFRGQVGFLALKGGRYASGSDAQKTSNGTQAKTGIGFQPVGLLLAGINSTTDNASVAHDRRSIGWASGTAARSCVWTGDQDNVADTIADSDVDTAAILKHMTEGTPTVDAEADLSSFDNDGYTLNWTADATARAFGYLAFGVATRTGHLPLMGVG